MTDLREQITQALIDALGFDGEPLRIVRDANRQTATLVMAVVQPALAAKDTEIAEAKADADRGWADAEERQNDATVWANTARGFQEAWQAAEKRAEQAEAILRDLVDPDPCYFDHNGHCQAHGYGPPCAHARARDHLAALDQPHDQPKLLVPKMPPREPGRSTEALYEEPGDQEGTP